MIVWTVVWLNGGRHKNRETDGQEYISSDMHIVYLGIFMKHKYK